MNVWSRVSRGLLCWLSLGLHVHVSTLSTSPTTVEAVPLQGFDSTRRRAIRRRSLCALVRSSTSTNNHAWISRKKFSLATQQQQRVVLSNLSDLSTCCFATPWPCHSIYIVSRLRPVTCQTCCLHCTCQVLFEQCSLCCRYHVNGPWKINIRIRGQQQNSHQSVGELVN